MADIGQGDCVLCVESDGVAGYPFTTVGAVYEVTDIEVIEDDEACSLHGECDGLGLQLAGCALPHDFWFCSRCFVKAGHKGSFDSLLTCKEIENA